MVWNWDKDDIRRRERERERREGEREYLRKIYTIILNIYTCSQYPNYRNLLRNIGSYNLHLSSFK